MVAADDLKVRIAESCIRAFAWCDNDCSISHSLLRETMEKKERGYISYFFSHGLTMSFETDYLYRK